MLTHDAVAWVVHGAHGMHTGIGVRGSGADEVAAEEEEERDDREEREEHLQGMVGRG